MSKTEQSEIKTSLTTTTETTRVSTILLTGKQIADMVCEVNGVRLSGRISVTFDVPGGADWSNTTLEIDEEHPVTVTWTEVDTRREKT